tara:strand:+ start:136 stop:462 length:327 start_codon:yes stop_codon:yes gene_type:complete
MTLLGQVDTGYTTTPWYVSWEPTYNEIHIQSALDDTDNHVLTMSYRHIDTCYKDVRFNEKPELICDPTGCVGLREAMANAKLIVESVNEKTFGGQLLINTTLFEEVGV